MQHILYSIILDEEREAIRINHYYQIWVNRIKYLLSKKVDIEPIFSIPDFSEEKEDFWYNNRGY